MSSSEDDRKEVQIGPESIKIPVSWDLEKLKPHLAVLTGDSFSSDNFNSDAKGLPLIRIRNLKDGDIATYYSGEYDEKYLIDNDSILIGMDGEFHTVWWDSNKKALLNQRVAKVEVADKSFDGKYLFYQLIGEIKKIETRTPATTVKHLSKKDINNILALQPLLPEQKKIAEILSTVDEAIQKTEEIIERTKELKKGLMQDLLTKGIGHEEFKEVQLGPKRTDIPKGWGVEFLKDLTKSFISGGTPDTDEEAYWNGDIPWTTCAYVKGPFFDGQKDFISRKGLEESSATILVKNGILFGTRVNVANTAKAMKDIAISQDLTGIITNSRIYPDFLVWYLIHNKERIAEQHSQGSTINGMIKSDVEKLKIPVPPLNEQSKIAKILSTVDEKIQRERAYKEKLEELKKGLMQDLLTGKVRVLPLLAEEEKEAIEESNVAG